MKAIIPIKLRVDVLSEFEPEDVIAVEHGGTGVTSIEELKQLLGVGSGGVSEGTLRFEPEYLNCTYENGEISYSEVLPVDRYSNGFIFTQPLDIDEKITFPFPVNFFSFGVLNTTLAEQVEYNSLGGLPYFGISSNPNSKDIFIDNSTFSASYNYVDTPITDCSFQLDGKGVVVRFLSGDVVFRELKLKLKSNCRTLFFKLNSDEIMQLPISIS